MPKGNFRSCLQQFEFLAADLRREAHTARMSGLTMFLHPQPYLYFRYRLDRAGYLLFQGAWMWLRIPFIPLFVILRIITGCNIEIPASASIGPGLRIFHPSLGCVIHSKVKAGSGLTLFGGNSLGMKRFRPGDYLCIGDNVAFGINAVALGPLCIGSDVQIGACSVAVKHDLPNHAVIAQQRRIIEPGEEHESSSGGCSSS